jgi:hypothetical protein
MACSSYAAAALLLLLLMQITIEQPAGSTEVAFCHSETRQAKVYSYRNSLLAPTFCHLQKG